MLLLFEGGYSMYTTVQSMSLCYISAEPYALSEQFLLLPLRSCHNLTQAIVNHSIAFKMNKQRAMTPEILVNVNRHSYTKTK